MDQRRHGTRYPAIPLSARRLDAYRVGIELLAYMRPRVERIARHDRPLAHQLKKSLPSMVNNLAEGMRRTGGDRPHHLTIALGSADEARASIDAALAFDYIEAQEAKHADALADRFAAMVYRLRQRFA